MRIGAGTARSAGALACFLLSACGHYADFTLPPLPGGGTFRFTFEEQSAPVLQRGAERDVLNPSVVHGRDIYYSAYDGHTWRTLLNGRVLLAPDPKTWEASYIAANGTALDVNGSIWYWYVAGPEDHPRIGLARSSDTRDWRKEPAPVLETGPYMSWDEKAVADPYVIRIGGEFYMYYLGQDRAAQQRLGLARSSDGLHWQKLRANPILELGPPGSFDENGLGEPAVWQSHGFYWMLYTGRGAGEIRRLGMARSTDGVHWTRLPYVFSGAHDWDSKVLCDPTVEVLDDSRVAVWFGGGDVARPDYNLNGQIGFAILRISKE